MKIPLNEDEQKVAGDLLKKGMFLVKYKSEGENRFAVYTKDPSIAENLNNDNILIDSEGSLSDLLFELNIIYRVFDSDDTD